MIVVVIVAILATIALPSYNNYLRRGQLTEATNNLSAFRIQMEQYYQDNNNYGTAVCGAANPTPAVYFGYVCTLTDPQHYVMVAAGVTGRLTAGFIYTITEANVQATTAAPGCTPSMSTTAWITC